MNIYNVDNGSLNFGTNNALAVTIDASGNLLVGKTATGLTAGFEVQTSGQITASQTNAPSAKFNRLTNDGEIIRLHKDGTTVGSIGNSGTTAMYVGSGDTQLLFKADEDQMVPFSAGGYRDAAISLGRSNARFKDLYLSGSVIAGDISGAAGVTTIGGADINFIQIVTDLGSSNPRLEPSVDNTIDIGRSGLRFTDIYATNGTIVTSDRNEKQDIEELSDAEQRVAVAAKGLLRKFRWKSSVAEKGDEARTHFGIIAQDLQAAFEAEGLDAGDYAMFINSTWTDEETGEERSRMGVRYSELLAFIIAAI
jgi:hypothetical protein